MQNLFGFSVVITIRLLDSEMDEKYMNQFLCG